MPPPPQLDFFVYDDNRPVTRAHPVWSSALPMGPGPSHSAAPEIRYRDYFQAVSGYLGLERFLPLRLALGSGRDDADTIRTVSVRLVKHGAFYHPAHVVVVTDAAVHHRVLNVAFSLPGRSFMESELEALNRMAGSAVAEQVPTVFHSGEVRTPSGHPVRMFLAEWFEGYSEFHITRDPKSGRQQWVLWDEGAGNPYLTDLQAAMVFEAAARILTQSFNPATGEEIRYWHHAAGDFVVRIDGANVFVKLVTVRQYGSGASAQGDDAHPEASRLMNQLVFFLTLSMRSRLDRLDGTGEWVWAGRPALEGTVRGFFRGLPIEERASFGAWLAGWDREDLSAILGVIVDGYHPQSPERPLLLCHLEVHIGELAAIIAAEGGRIGA